MSFASKFNKGSQFDVNTENFKYTNLKWLFNTYKNALFKVCGLYINTKGNFGESPTIVTDSCFVNLPEHCTQTAKDILADASAVEDIKNGKAGFTVYEYESNNPKAKGKKCYSIKFVDIDEKTVTTAIELPD